MEAHGAVLVPAKLSDHGCGIIGGLGLLFAVENNDTGSTRIHTGKSLAAGLPVQLDTNKPPRPVVRTAWP